MTQPGSKEEGGRTSNKRSNIDISLCLPYTCQMPFK
jgi:hypothetical protein